MIKGGKYSLIWSPAKPASEEALNLFYLGDVGVLFLFLFLGLFPDIIQSKMLNHTNREI